MLTRVRLQPVVAAGEMAPIAASRTLAGRTRFGNPYRFGSCGSDRPSV